MEHICIFTIYISLVMDILQFFFPSSALFSVLPCVVHCGFFGNELYLENPKLTSIFAKILCVPLILSLAAQL